MVHSNEFSSSKMNFWDLSSPIRVISWPSNKVENFRKIDCWTFNRSSEKFFVFRRLKTPQGVNCTDFYWCWNFSTLLFGHEITLMGELRSQEFIFEHQSSSERIIEGLYVDFTKNLNFDPWPWNCIFWVFDVSGTQFWQWNFAWINCGMSGLSSWYFK